MLSFLLSKEIKLEILGFRVGVLLTVGETPRTISKGLYHFTLAPAIYESSDCFISSTTFDVGHIHLCHFSYLWYISVILICIFQVTYDWCLSLFHVLIDHFYIFLHEMPIFFADFDFIFFLLLSCRNCAYILDASALSDVDITNIFFQPEVRICSLLIKYKSILFYEEWLLAKRSLSKRS